MTGCLTCGHPWLAHEDGEHCTLCSCEWWWEAGRSASEETGDDRQVVVEVLGDGAHGHLAFVMGGLGEVRPLLVGGSSGRVRSAVSSPRLAQKRWVVRLRHGRECTQVLTGQGLSTTVYNMNRAAAKGAEMTATAIATDAGSPDQARALQWAINRAVASFDGRDPSTVTEDEMLAAIETAGGEWCGWFELVGERVFAWRYTPDTHRSPHATKPGEIDYVLRSLYERYRGETVTA